MQMHSETGLDGRKNSAEASPALLKCVGICLIAAYTQNLLHRLVSPMSISTVVVIASLWILAFY